MQSTEQENKEKDGSELPAWGTVIDIPIRGLEFHGFGNENKVRVFKKKNPKTLAVDTIRAIGKSDRTEAFVRTVRAECLQKIKDLQAIDPAIAKVEFPIDGKVCPMRTDLYFLFDGTNPGRVTSIDWDNLVKAALDGIKFGTITPGLAWGLISDDKYSVGGLVYKCIGPEGGGDTLVIRIVRDGWRTLPEFVLLRNSIGAFPPYTADKGLEESLRRVEKGGIIGIKKGGLVGPDGRPMN